METAREKIEKIKEKVSSTSLFISRVPEKTKTRFMEVSKDEFADDYGMLLKKLIDVYDGLYPTGHEEIETKIDMLATEISMIKTKLDKLEKKPDEDIVTVSGKRIGRKRKNE